MLCNKPDIFLCGDGPCTRPVGHPDNDGGHWHGCRTCRNSGCNDCNHLRPADAALGREPVRLPKAPVVQLPDPSLKDSKFHSQDWRDGHLAGRACRAERVEGLIAKYNAAAFNDAYIMPEAVIADLKRLLED